MGKIGAIERDNIDEFYKIKDYKTVRSILQSMGRETVKVKITITGPMTLGTACALADINSALEHYDIEDEEALYSGFSQAILPLAHRALDIGAYLLIDEPLLSTGQVPLGAAKKILRNFVSSLSSFSIEEENVSCHVCGSIKSVAGLYDVLLGLDVPILSIGFSGDKERENFDIISGASLEEHDKKLAAGFISKINVEDTRKVIERYRRIEEKVGRENIRYIHPDCGFRMTPLEKVKLILEKMKMATDEIG